MKKLSWDPNEKPGPQYKSGKRSRIPLYILRFPLSKGLSGYSLFQKMIGNPLSTSPTASRGLRGSSNLARLDLGTGSLLPPLLEDDRFDSARRLLWPPPTASLPAAPPPSPTYGRTTPPSDDDSTLEQSPSSETLRRTGSPSGSQLRVETSSPSPPTYELLVIGPLSKLGQILTNLNQWSELALSTGVQLELVNRDELGPKRDWILSLRIPILNSGVVTRVKTMLSWMSFEEGSTSVISFDGSTVTLYALKSRALHDPLR